MNSRFRVGQVVRSRVNAQGLEVGMRGEVVAVESVSRGMFGTFVTYMVRVESGVVVPVGNGHLVLEPVNS